MAVRDDKRTEEIKLRLTEREMLDVSRLAAVDDRSVAEFIVRLLRCSMYGSVVTRLAGLQGTVGADEGRRGAEAHLHSVSGGLGDR